MSPSRVSIASLLGAALLSSSSLAATIEVAPDGYVPFPVNTAGTIARFPGEVQIVTGRNHFEVKRLETGDLEIRPTGGRSEDVTVVLAGGRAVTLQLVPSSSADTFSRIAFRSQETHRSEPPELSFLRSILRREVPAGKLGGKSQKHAGITLDATRAYSVPGFRALRYEATCKEATCALNPEGLRFVALRPKLAYANKYQLKKGETAQVFVVFETNISAENLTESLQFGGGKPK